MSKEFQPLSSLPECEIPRINWQLELPDYAPSNEVGINTRALSRFAKLGGYDSLTIRAEDMGTTKTVPGLDGMNGDGSATSSAGGSVYHPDNVKALAKDGREPGCNDSYDAYHWRTGVLTVNSQVILDRLSRNRDDALRSGAAWSKELDKALKSGLTASARESLIAKSTPNGLLLFIASMGISQGIAIAEDTISSSNTASGLVGFAFYNILRGVIKGHSIKDYRPSVLPTYQVDRLMIVAGLSRATRFAKPLTS